MINYDLPQSFSFIKVQMVGDNRHGEFTAKKKKSLKTVWNLFAPAGKGYTKYRCLGHIFRCGVYLCLEVRSEEWQSVYNSSQCLFYSSFTYFFTQPLSAGRFKASQIFIPKWKKLNKLHNSGTSQGKDTGVPAEKDGESVQSCLDCYNNGGLQLGLKRVASTKLEVCFFSALKNFSRTVSWRANIILNLILNT